MKKIMLLVGLLVSFNAIHAYWDEGNTLSFPSAKPPKEQQYQRVGCMDLPISELCGSNSGSDQNDNEASRSKQKSPALKRQKAISMLRASQEIVKKISHTIIP
jgi:hypothetical protein